MNANLYPSLPTRRVMRGGYDFEVEDLEPVLRSGRRPRILLVEDDDAMRTLIASELRRDGYRVLACQDGLELVHRIEAYKELGVPLGFSLVISDVRMPKISGLELLELAREVPVKLPFILISAFADMETRIEASHYSVSAFLSKPFEIDQLRAAVRANLCRES